MPRGAGGTLFFAADETVLVLPDATEPPSTTVLRLRYEGANRAPTVSARDPLPGVVNELIGNDPTKLQTNLPTYAGLTYASL